MPNCPGSCIQTEHTNQSPNKLLETETSSLNKIDQINKTVGRVFHCISRLRLTYPLCTGPFVLSHESSSGRQSLLINLSAVHMWECVKATLLIWIKLFRS